MLLGGSVMKGALSPSQALEKAPMARSAHLDLSLTRWLLRRQLARGDRRFSWCKASILFRETSRPNHILFSSPAGPQTTNNQLKSTNIHESNSITILMPYRSHSDNLITPRHSPATILVLSRHPPSPLRWTPQRPLDGSAP